MHHHPAVSQRARVPNRAMRATMRHPWRASRRANRKRRRSPGKLRRGARTARRSARRRGKSSRTNRIWSRDSARASDASRAVRSEPTERSDEEMWHATADSLSRSEKGVPGVRHQRLRFEGGLAARVYHPTSPIRPKKRRRQAEHFERRRASAGSKLLCALIRSIAARQACPSVPD